MKVVRMHAPTAGKAVHLGVFEHEEQPGKEQDNHLAAVEIAKKNRTLCRIEAPPQGWHSALMATKGQERNVIEVNAFAYADTYCRACWSKGRARFPLPDQLNMAEIKFYAANQATFGALSNLYRRVIEFEGRSFPSAEYAYQYAKAREPAVRDWLMAAPTNALLAKAAHQLTRAWEVAPGWSAGKVERMRRVLRAKFTQHEDLKRLLLCTGDAKLIEWGTIDDDAGRFWGIVASTGKGKNTLGQLLMEVREELRSGAAQGPGAGEPAPDGLPDCGFCTAQLGPCSHPGCDEATCPDSNCKGFGHQYPSVKHNDPRFTA